MGAVVCCFACWLVLGAASSYWGSCVEHLSMRTRDLRGAHAAYLWNFWPLDYANFELRNAVPQPKYAFANAAALNAKTFPFKDYEGTLD